MSMSSSQSHREHTGSCASWVRYSLHEGKRAPQELWGPHSARVRGPITGPGFGWWIWAVVRQQGFTLGWGVLGWVFQ